MALTCDVGELEETIEDWIICEQNKGSSEEKIKGILRNVIDTAYERAGELE